MTLSARLRRELSPFQIFLIDDEELTVETLSWILADAGFRNVHGFTNAGEAINMLRCLRPDLILTDIHMPEVDGSMLTRLVREFEHLDSIPVVAITADDRRETAEGILSEGANAVLVKPITADQLIKQVSKVHAMSF